MMLIGPEWHRALHRFLASPMLEALAAAAVLCIALYALLGTDAFVRTPHMPVLFGAR